MPYNTPGGAIRPVTSKARGICKYYTTERGCFSGDMCKFLHSMPKSEAEMEENQQPLLTPYDQTKRCRYFDQGFCKRGESCWFLHSDKSHIVQEEDENCSICFEKPLIYGLLGGCSHIFCLTCIRQWRDPHNKPDSVTESGNTKRCPMCRMSSRFITPSSKFLKDGTEEKKIVTQAYMESMGKIQCRYFQKSLLKNKNKPICPYGKDCFYSHLKGDGTRYLFKDGVEVCMERYRNKRDFLLDIWPIVEIMNRTSDHLTSEPQVISSNDNPAIHRRHNPAQDDNEEGLYTGAWWSLQEARMRSINDVNSAGLLLMEFLRAGRETTGAGLSEGNELEQNVMRRNGQESEDERENEVMERLEMMADEMLASSALREGMPVHVEPPQSENAAADFYSGDDSEGEMPDLQSVSSDSEEDETDESDTDTDAGGHDLEALSSGSNDQLEEPTDAADDKASMPSDAFTTDGRGRVISVGDPPHSGSDFEQPELSAGEPATRQSERRGGFLGWIGSLISSVSDFCPNSRSKFTFREQDFYIRNVSETPNIEISSITV